MNVTVIIAQPLQAACEGRSRIELGVPPTSDVADVLQTVMALYPGLKKFIVNEKPLRGHQLSVGTLPGKLILFATNASRP